MDLSSTGTKKREKKFFIYLSCKTVANMGLPGTVSFAEALRFKGLPANTHSLHREEGD